MPTETPTTELPRWGKLVVPFNVRRDSEGPSEQTLPVDRVSWRHEIEPATGLPLVGSEPELVIDGWERDADGFLWWPGTSNGDMTGRPIFALPDNTRCQRIVREGICQVCADPLTEERRHWFLMRDALERGDYDAGLDHPGALLVKVGGVCARCRAITKEQCPVARASMVLVSSEDHNYAGAVGDLIDPRRGPVKEHHYVPRGHPDARRTIMFLGVTEARDWRLEHA